jgi:class III lanthionine synthetase
MRSRHNPLHRLLNKDYHESFDAYVPRKADFYNTVASMLPEGWQIQRQGIWFHCGSPENTVPLQGWKIHISASPGCAPEIFARVVSILFRHKDTDFKFVLDMSLVFLTNSKNWSRGSSGKFITIYPSNNRFVELIEEIYLSTKDLEGPYILSDHRYKDSRIVFYRYGGMRLNDVLTVQGERTPVLIAPDGTQIPDERRPYPVTPPWAEDVLQRIQGDESAENSPCLKQGRYQVEEVLSFSNSGGVYRALDKQTDKTVVIKEARPCVNHTGDGYDATALLQKEYRLLSLLKDTGIAPAPVEIFKEWEHWFLVEEFIEGLPLTCHSSENNILLRTRASHEEYANWRRMFISLCKDLFHILAILHRNNIIFGDLSPANVIVEATTVKLRLIDFEGAFQLDVDRPGTLYTPGFVSQNRLAGCAAAMEDDYYAMGAVLMSYLFPITSFFHLNPGAIKKIMASIQRDSRLPEDITQMILSLMSADAAQRLRPDNIGEVLQACSTAEPVALQPEKVTHDYAAVVQGIVVHLTDGATFERHDRLFPPDQKVFTTNPVSLAWGAAGIGYALSQMSGYPQDKVAAWILKREINPRQYAPGLYAGMSGIAWSLLEMGYQKEAEGILQDTFNHKLLNAASDVFYGIAGWGMTCLRFFLETGNQLYLEKARMAGTQLLESCQRTQGSCCWSNAGNTPIGFAHGSSGIALFLLYLYLATGEEEFIEAGKQGLEFDIRHAVTTKDDGFSWRQSAGSMSPLYPYWENGSTGIGMSILRYWHVLGEERYWSILEKIFIDTDRKYAVFSGKFMGLAGLGDFLMDMYEATHEVRFLQSAYKVADGIMHFQVQRNGIAFPGDSISRLSCSYGNGSAGIGLFFNRLIGRKGSPFMLDSLFAEKASLNGPSQRVSARLQGTMNQRGIAFEHQ